MPVSGDWVTVGIDNGGTANNGTLLDSNGTFLVTEMAELPSLVREGPDKAIAALVDSFDKVLAMTGVARERVRAVGLDTPGPASADGVLVTGGATNFGHPDWSRFNIRAALEERLGIPVLYNNDGNAAALYAHHVRHGADARSAARSPRSLARVRRRRNQRRAHRQGRVRDGGRARSHADPHDRTA